MVLVKNIEIENLERRLVVLFVGWSFGWSVDDSTRNHHDSSTVLLRGFAFITATGELQYWCHHDGGFVSCAEEGHDGAAGQYVWLPNLAKPFGQCNIYRLSYIGLGRQEILLYNRRFPDRICGGAEWGRSGANPALADTHGETGDLHEGTRTCKVLAAKDGDKVFRPITARLEFLTDSFSHGWEPSTTP